MEAFGVIILFASVFRSRNAWSCNGSVVVLRGFPDPFPRQIYYFIIPPKYIHALHSFFPQQHLTPLISARSCVKEVLVTNVQLLMFLLIYLLANFVVRCFLLMWCIFRLLVLHFSLLQLYCCISNFHYLISLFYSIHETHKALDETLFSNNSPCIQMLYFLHWLLCFRIDKISVLKTLKKIIYTPLASINLQYLAECGP